MLETLGVILLSFIPLFNIPLFLNIGKRRHACDIRILWTTGIWLCSALALVAGLISGNFTFQVVATAALVIFTFVLLYTVGHHYQHASKKATEKVERNKN